MTEEKELLWDSKAKAKYDKMLSLIPLFHREITRQVVDKQALLNARLRGSSNVSEEDIVRAFLSEVPKAFYSMMIRLMNDVGFDYEKYEGK
ncbi:MAG TPA: hypothetical protein PLH56_04905 [Candidatus Omnitrophota bacterium]|nr:hypothetical protein [Candidatus Omnitrophota bacterium]HPN88659.1 hypothetical protein [Candidatus Omnitrophota bacterium]